MNLKDCSVYSFEKDITYEMASAFIRFLYNDNTDLPNDDKFLLQLMVCISYFFYLQKKKKKKKKLNSFEIF